MLRTPLHERHIALGAKMVWFAGWDMPIQYSSIIDEHMTVRKASGAFDVSHMGDLLIRGKGAGELVNRICTNDVAHASVGRCVYAHILNDKGMILDDTIVTVLGNEEYLMVPNAATTAKILEWIQTRRGQVELINLSRDLATIAVQGPTAKDVVAELTSANLTDMKFFWGDFFRLDKVKSGPSSPATPLLKSRNMKNGPGSGITVFVSRTGYTGEDGFEIVCENADAIAVWDSVIEKGKSWGLKPVGLGARDTLRLEKGLLLSGTDFDGSQTSLQTGPDWCVDWTHDFIGKEALLAQRQSGSYDRLVCMLAKDRGIPRHGYEIMSGGSQVGVVTSGTLSPVLKQGIAMGYVPLKMAVPGLAIQIKVRENLVNAGIVKPPFVKRGLN